MPPASDRPSTTGLLPVRHIAEIEARRPEAQWLIEPLWAASGVGIVGGLPKAMKTWLATELALSVATGTPALGRFPANAKGPVLVFAAEDDPPAMRARFEAVASARGLRLADVAVFLIEVAELRLDDPAELDRLRRTVADKRPRLLVLDPFVRLVRTVDENSAQEVSRVLGSLRALQRELDVAILLVHHMRKSSSPNLAQQLRGSGDFAAWSDSAIYITKKGDHRILTVEHRGAPSPPPVIVRLQDDPTPHFVVVDAPSITTPSDDPLRAAIVERLRSSSRPESTVGLRDHLKVRKSTLVEALEALRANGVITRSRNGWLLSSHEETNS